MAMGLPTHMPPDDYWAGLSHRFDEALLCTLRGLSTARRQEFIPLDLGLDIASAKALLDQFASDGWVTPHTRYRCPKCEEELTLEQAAGKQCPLSECEADFKDNGGVVSEHIYRRALAASRSIAWVVAVHGMKSRGAWQERLTWLVSTTWGRALPLEVYKYGYIIPSVVLWWRRITFRRKLRSKLVERQAQLAALGTHGPPDVIAHSFGTWLLGHLCLKELDRPVEKRLRLGRVVLVGCVLRPDFDWSKLQREGIVQEVLNHFGDRDRIVPLAHYSIWDSGPSGRQGFIGASVVNVRASGCGHDDLLSMVKRLPTKAEIVSSDVRDTFMGSALYTTWRPFFELPTSELAALTTEPDGGPRWSQSVWLLRGTVFPVLVIPGLVLLAAWLISLMFILPFNSGPVIARLACWFGIAVACYCFFVACSLAWNWVARPRKTHG